MSNTMPTAATAAVLWRKAREEGVLITLPSGNVAKLKPVALDSLLLAGRIPDMLTPIVAKMLWADEGTETDQIAEVVEMAKGFADLVNLIIPAVFVEPVVIAEGEPGEGEITLDDISFEDKVTVFQLATSGAATLTKFREKQVRDLAALSNGEGNGVKTKRPGKPKRQVDGAPV